MTVQFPMPAETAALNDKEVEVLRLLAAGHTVKSIAVTLGKSEASINERLRDARRKTGVGSSRELARLLDAQKIWDKNIDLSVQNLASHGQEQPPGEGRSRSKGTLVMAIALPIAAAVGLLVAGMDSASQAGSAPPAQATATQQSPLVGRWSLDVGRIPENERPRSVTIDFSVSSDQKWTTQVKIVRANGSTMEGVSTAATDGVAVAAVGTMPFIDAVKLRQPSPDTLVMSLAKNGSPVSTRVYTVAKDGQTMTETIIWAGGKVPRLETTYFNRIG